jgi:hypothetical protein
MCKTMFYAKFTWSGKILNFENFRRKKGSAPDKMEEDLQWENGVIEVKLVKKITFLISSRTGSENV